MLTVGVHFLDTAEEDEEIVLFRRELRDKYNVLEQPTSQ